MHAVHYIAPINHVISSTKQPKIHPQKPVRSAPKQLKEFTFSVLKVNTCSNKLLVVKICNKFQK